jgi:prepilin-type N-terminal cleavage/methylation domain-containing protein
MSRAGRAGFTLIEVTVALVLTGTVALLAHRLFGAVTDHVGNLREARLDLDRWSNAHRFLQAAFLSLEVGMDSAGPFVGRWDRVSFPSWLLTSDGWLERGTVELGLDGDRWIATSPSHSSVVLARGVTALRFDYLLEPGAESGWVAEWESAVSAPLAVRIRLTQGAEADTMLYLIKARG